MTIIFKFYKMYITRKMTDLFRHPTHSFDVDKVSRVHPRALLDKIQGKTRA